jgi:hypothetical protein
MLRGGGLHRTHENSLKEEEEEDEDDEEVSNGREKPTQTSSATTSHGDFMSALSSLSPGPSSRSE